MAREFDTKLSYRLDYAVVKSEEGSSLWRFIKRLLEWWIFGGKP